MAQIRTHLSDGSPHHRVSLQALRERVDSEDLNYFERTEENWNYARSYLAQAAAFLYRLEGDQRYADIAIRTLRAVYDDPDPDKRLPESGQHGLSRATVGLGFALAYAWCGEAWNEEQREFVRQALHRKLVMWEDFRHVNLFAQRGSNWVAVCRGSELMTILALNEREQRHERYEWLIAELSHHITTAFDAIGATQEGIGYTDYGSIFLLPAIIASMDAGDGRLLQLLRDQGIQLQRKAAYAHSPAVVPAEHRLGGRNLTLFSGVGGLGAGNQGWGSLLLAVTPAQDLPYLHWFYDHTFGIARPAQGAHLPGIEPYRQAAVWALLFYPEGVSRSPEGHWPLMISGKQGRHYIRQRWRDERDIMLNIHAQADFHPRAWAMVEVGQWSLAAYGRMLVGGPRLERSGQQHSMLLVDDSMGSRRDLGRVAHSHYDANTAMVIIDGHDHYRHLGVENYQRHLLAHFSDPDSNSAILALYDRIDARQNHSYRWGLPIVDEALDVIIGQDAGLSHVQLRSPEGGQLSAWVVSPSGVAWQYEDGLVSFTYQGDSTEIFVAMSLRDDGDGQLETLAQDVRHRHLRIDGIDLVHDRVEDRLLSAQNALAWKAPNYFSTVGLPPVRGLEAKVLGEQSIAVRWWNRRHPVEVYRIEGRFGSDQTWLPLASVSADKNSVILDDLRPGTTYELRVASHYPGAEAVYSNYVGGTTWAAGQQLIIEDFAPREEEAQADISHHRLGHWQVVNQDRGWQLDKGEGSPRGAQLADGYLRTSGRVARGKSNAVYLDTIRIDLSAATAALEVDLRSQGSTRFAPMLRLADGRWLRAQQCAHVYALNHWHTQRWQFADIAKWVPLDIETLTNGSPVSLSSEQLATVTGLGIYAHWASH
ncbi:MAG: fibronectin type III domain-containing protein, partial [Planctomycetota bacterium]